VNCPMQTLRPALTFSVTLWGELVRRTRQRSQRLLQRRLPRCETLNWPLLAPLLFFLAFYQEDASDPGLILSAFHAE
jgi:hypothetical protein